MSKYKIDQTTQQWCRSLCPFELFARKRFLGVSYWSSVDTFRTIEDAADHMNKMIGLPREYDSQGRRV